MQLRALLLDLDGTLVDTAPDMVGALNRVLEAHQRPACDIALASKLVSNGARALIEFGFPDVKNEQDQQALIEQFLNTYQQHVCIDSALYDGMHDVLSHCESNSIKWGVITNKPLHLAKDVMAGLGLLERCAILLGGDSLPVKKPDPVPMLHACMLLSVAPSECIYIGDHERDIQAGNAAGMDTGAASWGYLQHPVRLEDWNPTCIFSTPYSLYDYIATRSNA